MSTPSGTPPIGQGFSLVMQLQDPRRLAELMTRLGAVQPRISKALGALDYIHFARFLPLWDAGRLLIVTEFDGAMKDYVMDFAAVLDDEFSMILSYMNDGPRLPVSRFPDEFWSYVERNTHPAAPFPPHAPPFSAYAGKTVIDIIGIGGGKQEVPLPSRTPEPPQLEDVQANVLRGYGGTHAVHLAVEFASAQQGRELLAALCDASQPVHATAAAASKPPYCLNLGLTYAGLQALELPPDALQRFPKAFREGPAAREAALAPKAQSNPEDWRLGKPGEAVHALLSLYTKTQQQLQEREAALSALVGASGITLHRHHAEALDSFGTVHFGYRDGLSQPRIAGVHDAATSDGQPLVPAADFLLGAGQINSRGGNFIGELPPALADNATYAAVRVMQQDEAAFRDFIARTAAKHGLTEELVAAKLMGRWRDGSPLVRYPTHPAGWTPTVPAGQANHFDYAHEGLPDDDSQGRRCPLGAHIRRMNPRNARVMGVPSLRRLIRRGLPYGPAFERNPAAERGLFGLFFCGDLESQFEFLLRVWGHGDLATSGIRDTVDPFVGASATKFRFHADAVPLEAEVEKALTTTVGALYLFVPGLAGLAWLARAGWSRDDEASEATRAYPSHKPVAAPATDLGAFSPLDPVFRADPYRLYAQFRQHQPICKIAFYDSYWVFSHELVKAACTRDGEFVKPGKQEARKTAPPFEVLANFDDGLFFMDTPRHQVVRPAMDQAFAEAIRGAEAFAQREALRLLDAPLREGRLEVVGDYAAKLPMRVFMNIMGIPQEHWAGVDGWVRTALEGHDRGAPIPQRIGGASSTMALRAYFTALGLGCPLGPTAAGSTPLMQGITACPAAGGGALLSPSEAMQTALHFALGGYLSTEFLITTGVVNLLRCPQQLALLREQPQRIPAAICEMLRYDAPFQMADRVVAKDCSLGGVDLKRGDSVTLVYGSANRDAACFGETAEHFDITRAPHGEGFAFGPAQRYCIGAPLAMTVAETALRTLLENCPTLDIVEVGEWVADPYYRSLRKLLVALR